MTPKNMAARTWFGYGRWDAPFWFVGMEPGGVDENATYETWLQLGGKELIDCPKHHLASNCSTWHSGKRPPTQATWRRLIQLLLSYKQQETNLDAVRIYQRDKWGTLSGETASLNLSSLHAKNLNTAVDRFSYQEERLSTLKMRLEENSPIFIVFYGKTYAAKYEQIIGCKFDESGFAWHKSTLCFLAPHPAGLQSYPEANNEIWWVQRGENIRELIERGPKITQHGFQEYRQADLKSFIKTQPRSYPTGNDEKRLKMSPLPDLHIKNPRLSVLKTEWENLGITRNFSKVHHSYRVPGSEKRESLNGFIKYCDKTDIKEENSQTLERALNVAFLMKKGDSFEDALEKAWTAYPRVGR